ENNVQRLKQLFGDDRRKNNLQTHIVYGAGHSMEVEAEKIQLSPNLTYRHFFRVSPRIPVEIIRFLKKFGFIVS
ncbi:MAG: hypothetical protein AAF206_01990, partial [Bacteroidota bacterium]